MNEKSKELLEYNKVKEILKGFSISEIGKKLIDELEPSLDINIINKNMDETTEARAITNMTSSIPLHSLSGIKNVKDKINKGMVLNEEDLSLLSGLLKDINKMKIFMEQKQDVAPTISLYSNSLFELSDLKEEIDRCIILGRVDDKASSKLSKIRKKIRILEDRIKAKLDNVLKNAKYRDCIQDSIVSVRNGRYVIPIKSEYKKSVEGNIHDKSSSGSTVFIEPTEVKKAQDELNICKVEEEKEVYIILSTLTNMVTTYERELNIDIETMGYYDFIFAKGKYSKSIGANSVNVNNNNYINIINGKHPLIGDNVVPLDFKVGDKYKGVVITGPNTGGKTVTLKTVGLLTMMVQSGLHVQADKESDFSIFIDILVDIGDGQSIEQNLSTFSAHIKNIIDILSVADNKTLVIMDEIGSGTDPGEGMGIAVSVLEEVYSRGSIILATTHYSEIKDFAKNHKGFINGSMEFDINTLKPIYKLNLGKPGESNAFLIALRLGMRKEIIERAHKVTYKEEKDYSNYKWDDNIKLCNNIVIQNHKQQVEKLKSVEKKASISKKQKKKSRFNIGDCVYVSFMKKKRNYL